jgi:hypothetical protein
MRLAPERQPAEAAFDDADAEPEAREMLDRVRRVTG